METWRNALKSRTEIFSVLKEPGMVICVFDTETTGLDGNKDKIIQFSGIKYKVNKDLSLEEVDRMDIYINPKMELPKKIIEITGITPMDLIDKPDETQVVDEIFKFLDESDILAGHNTPFDIKMIRGMADRTGKFPPVSKPIFNTLEMARDLIPCTKIENYQLRTVVEYLYPDKEFKFHSSIEDVTATGMILATFLRNYFDLKPNHNSEEKKKVVLIKGSLFINPRAKSQQRIRLTLSEGEMGDIYYDIVKKTWSHKETTIAKRLWLELDMADVEEQFLKKYAYPFKMNTVSEVATSWIKFKKEKDKKIS